MAEKGEIVNLNNGDSIPVVGNNVLIKFNNFEFKGYILDIFQESGLYLVKLMDNQGCMTIDPEKIKEFYLVR
jgi:hypothetical protein